MNQFQKALARVTKFEMKCLDDGDTFLQLRRYIKKHRTKSEILFAYKNGLSFEEMFRGYDI